MFTEIWRNGSSEKVVGEINVCDWRNGGDFQGDYSGEWITAEIETDEVLAVTDIPRDRTVERVSLELELVEALATVNEVQDVSDKFGWTGQKDLQNPWVPEITWQNGVELILGDVQVLYLPCIAEIVRDWTREVVLA